MTESEACLFCGEPVEGDGIPMRTIDSRGVRTNHRECALREVLGGIGHQIAHDYWCTKMHDPDAGLTHYQSARLVALMYDMMGDELITRSYASGRDGDGAVPEAGVLSDDEWGEMVLQWASQEDPPEWPPPQPPAA